MRKQYLRASGVLLLLLAGANPSKAATFYVAKHGSDSNDGAATNTPWLTIQNAVGHASVNNGDEIDVGEGLYTESVTFPRSGKYSLTLKGGFYTNDWSWAPATHPTIIKPASTSSDVITLNSQSNSLTGLTLTGGKRGIYIFLASPQSAAVYNGVSSFTRCIVTNNTDHGIYHENSGYNWNGVTVKNCLIATNSGDGIRLDQNHTTPYYNYLINCTIVSNGGNGYADGNQYQRSTYITNCIIANNGGYGVRRWGATLSYSDYVGNSCFYGNSSGNVSSVSTPYPKLRIKNGVFSTDPRFVGSGDYRLQDGSPCVNAGLDASGFGVTDDLDGNARSGSFDLGCYESVYSAITKHSATYVNASQPGDTLAGTNAATAKKTIGAGLSITAAGGTCYVAAGTYTEEVLVPSANVTLQGENRDTTIISSAQDSVVSILDTNITVQGFTITGGGRGVMFAEDCGIGSKLVQCIIRQNTLGILSSEADSKTRRCELSRCIVSSNTSHAIYAVCSAGWPAALIVRNCLIADNGGNGFMAYINNQQAYDSYAENCTIANNGGNGYEDTTEWNRSFCFTNCIISGNKGYGIRQSWTGGGYIDPIGYSCIYGNTNGNLSSLQTIDPRIEIHTGVFLTDPKFVGSGDYHLQDGSPCVGYGSTLPALTDDLDGNARSAPYDMGCYESAYSAAPRHAVTFANATKTDDSGSGTTADTAKRRINAALAITDTNGTCNVAAGTYGDELILSFSGVSLVGADQATTVVTGISGRSVLMIGANNVRVRDFTFRGGTRGLYLSGQEATNVLIERCTFQANTNGVVIPNDAVIRSYTLSQCSVISNASYGIYHYPGCVSSLTARNCLIAANGNDGVNYSVNWFAPGSTYLLHCTIARNGGSGFRSENSYQTKVYFTNCIISSNALYGLRKGATLPASQSNWVAYCCISDNLTNFDGTAISIGSGMVNQSPGFKPNKYTLADGAPCIDTATPIGITVDLAGNPRPILLGYDIGAYEWMPRQGTVFVVH